MAMYIKGMGNISPQQTWGKPDFDKEVTNHTGNWLRCLEPEYEQWIDGRALRRMSRILRMGIASAIMALKDAGIERPDGIITGTGFGCLEDTGTFLAGMIDKHEQNLNPTPFIQSTHNTIGSQIALMLNCYGYNQTYTHDAFSFESALMDALMSSTEHLDRHLLVGGVDEVTEFSHSIHSRFGIFRKNQKSNLDLFSASQKGTVHGEGATWFACSGRQDAEDKACVEAVTTLYKPDAEALGEGIDDFMHAIHKRPADIDMLLLGKSGDVQFDKTISEIAHKKFGASTQGVFKHLCGEYPVASAFALWLAASMLHTGRIPESVAIRSDRSPLKNILIFNQYFGTHYSLILVRSCRDMA